MHPAENALSAKARAMFANRLTPAQLRDMLSCPSCEEVAAYLKEKTFYGDYLTGRILSPIDPKWLESRLRQALYRHLEVPAAVAYAIHAPIYRYGIIPQEIARLSQTLAAAAGHTHLHLWERTVFFTRHSCVDWDRVEQATDVAGWLESLQGSLYYAVCRPFVDTVTGRVNRTSLDCALYNSQMRQLTALVETAYEGKERQTLLEQLQMHIDLNNLSTVYRLAVVRGEHTAVAGNVAVTVGGRLSPRQLQSLMDAPDDRAFRAAVDATVYHDLPDWLPDGYIEQSVNQYCYRICRHRLWVTTNPSVALLCYDTLRRVELNNIVHIIEGVRYGIPAQAAALLVGAEEMG